MKEKLEALGWVCGKCNCVGKIGYDCAHKDHRRVMIKTGKERFKIYKNSLMVESGFAYELETKMKAQELL